MIVVATWPLMLSVQTRLWNRRSLAVAAMTLGLLLVLVIPLLLVIGALVENGERLVGWAESLSTAKLPPPPEVLGHVPFVGAKAVAAWEEVATRRRRQARRKNRALRRQLRAVARRQGRRCRG